MSSVIDEIDLERVPCHIAVIMDGNGRWAGERGLPRTEGHREGAKVIERLTDAAVALKVACVSLYAFSTENWSRPVNEIHTLWNLLQQFFEEKLPELREKNVRVVHSGFEKGLPKGVIHAIHNAVSETSANNGLTLNFCLNYGSRQEIVDAVNRWAERANKRDKLTEKQLSSYLFTGGLPDVDLLIRTSGEMRISNFLLWQIAYAELYFTGVYWPDFTSEHLYEAVRDYQKRNRRFGNICSQKQ
ncbi:MAG: isoprenyl transferase [Spirochaetota bacterium]